MGAPSAQRLPLSPGGVILALLATGSLAGPAPAQRVVPRIGSICPMGTVDTLNGRCWTLDLMNDSVQPTNGQPCPEGWLNGGGGYCRRT